MKSDAKFIMLSGIPGSGKTTLARSLLDEVDGSVWLSSDAIRGELFGDESVQGNPKLVFDEMNSRTVEALTDGFSVIYDATNLSASRRRDLLADLRARGLQFKAICYEVWCQTPVAINRQQCRERQVPISVIRRMAVQAEPVLGDEGWDEIIHWNGETFNEMPF